MANAHSDDISRPPFAGFAPRISQPSLLREAITKAARQPEEECVPALVEATSFPAVMRGKITGTARKLVEALRGKDSASPVDSLMKEYALSSQEGIALMCLAEALLRIPDVATRDDLIRDKIAPGDWSAHLGGDRGVFVNAATWGLVVTGRLVQTANDHTLSNAMTRMIGRLGEPVIRQGVDLAMRLLGEQFVVGQSIEQALERARKKEKRGFTYSYDMLGEEAVTAKDARDYFNAYAGAIHAIGKHAIGDGIHARPGISIKLSALHPRYSRAQADRVMSELLPRVEALAQLAKNYEIGLNIDAEESERLEISLDVFESLARDPALKGWDGLGFVVQAYGKRCPAVVDWLIDLGRSAGRRIMVRLVKGAYWDAEIKNAQVEGVDGFPVYTRKLHTDIAYLACAQKLLAAKAEVFPQFATHNAQSLASIYHMAPDDFTPGDYEFQCLHGMGEPLYQEVVGKEKLDRPCRIYAPVGTHGTLLAYLVRRLLENGANSSFVNRISDQRVEVDDLIADPSRVAAAMDRPGAPHPAISLPSDMFADRRNSAGLDVNDENVLASLSADFIASNAREWRAGDFSADPTNLSIHPVTNPGDTRDILGKVALTPIAQIEAMTQRAAASQWPSTSVEERVACLERAADAMEADMPSLLALTIREAGKSLPNAIAEVREAVDFLRYYAQQARHRLENTAHLGPVVCISPWNFPLAIFTGQVAAALVAGNPVLAKPAEETPLIAAEAVRILYEAGIPADALQLVLGGGDAGAALVGADPICGVMFTGSTEVARLINQQLSGRISDDGRPIRLIAETGGQNAMIVDSSALAQQVVNDVIASAFDSAGQRCSAMRILCLQEDIAEATLAMLKGAMSELRIGRTDQIATDIGPVISAKAQKTILDHIAKMEERGFAVHSLPLPAETAHGTFVAPTIIEVNSTADLGREVFGPVLHVVRYQRKNLEALITAINATGYGLTFGLQTRMDSTVEKVLSLIRTGNRYVNRNTIGAVVGVQPFGGWGLSGTGPKAGGPLYLTRLAKDVRGPLREDVAAVQPALAEFAQWLDDKGEALAAEMARAYGNISPLGLEREMPGPVGERNFYAMHARGNILLSATSAAGIYQQIAAVLASGNRAAIMGDEARKYLGQDLPLVVSERLNAAEDVAVSAALFEGDQAGLLDFQQVLARRDGPLVPLQSASSDDCREGLVYRTDWLCEEVSTSINTAAAGGNASLMALEE